MSSARSNRDNVRAQNVGKGMPRHSSPPQGGGPAKSDHVIRVTIPSNFTAGREVQQRILSAVEACGFTAHSSFAVKLALEEALINAIKHGNKLDTTKQVHVNAVINSHSADITIEDEGPGFERTSVPDPTAEENLEKCSGRGLLLIEAYMNTVEWSHQGRRLHMIKRNGEEPQGR